MLAEVRSFFAHRKVMEVDCPILSRYAAIDAYIDLIEAHTDGERRFLHTSPEYGMKRLLAEGVGDIYQLSHVFREGEKGWRHLPEFMMIEWYRIGFSLDQLIEETVALASLFIKDQKVEKLTYEEAFLRYVGVNPYDDPDQLFLQVLREKGISPSSEQLRGGREALLNLVWGTAIEPFLGKGQFTVITNYPKEQAALARLTSDGKTAHRFELYFNSFELANGYHELANAEEQEKRFEEANEERKALLKKTLPADPHFLEALKRGLPDCCGVAVGFDRLLMLHCRAETIDQVVPFSWESQ